MNVNQISIEQMQKNASAAEKLLKSLGNGHRLMVLCHLVSGEKSVGEIEQQLELSRSSLSQHLGRLRNQGIVASRKEGTTVYYRIVDEKSLRVLECLYDVFCR